MCSLSKVKQRGVCFTKWIWQCVCVCVHKESMGPHVPTRLQWLYTMIKHPSTADLSTLTDWT